MKGRKVTGSSRGEKKKIRRLRNSQNVFVSDSACLDLICQIKILAVKLLFSVGVEHWLLHKIEYLRNVGVFLEGLVC